MEFLVESVREGWALVAEVAPYLLLGFALAGLISMLVRRSFVERMLGSAGLGSIIRASLIGVPLPMCSCGVIPVAAAIRTRGASPGATASFLAATPQMGVDSLVATWGLLGPFLAVARLLVAFVSGLLAGIFVQRVSRDAQEVSASGSANSALDVLEEKPSLRRAARYAFVTLPRELAGALILGLLLAAIVGAILPADAFARIGLDGVWPYMAITAAATPMYICSTGAIPFAYVLMDAGLSPGAVLVFLVTGPAVNAATLTTMHKYLGGRAIIAYVLAIVVTAWTAGFVIDAGLGKQAVLEHLHAHELAPGWFKNACGVLLVLMLSYAGWSRWRDRGGDCGGDCCG